MASSDPSKRPQPGPWPPAPESTAMPPSSWAKRTDFRPKFSGETNASTDSGQFIAQPKPKPKPKELVPLQVDLEAGRVRPVNGESEHQKVTPPAAPVAVNMDKDQAVKRRRDSDSGVAPKPAANGQATAAEPQPPPQPSRRVVRNDDVGDVLPQTVDDDGFVSHHSHMKYERHTWSW